MTATSATTGIGNGNQTIPGAAAAQGGTAASGSASAPSSTSTVKPNGGGRVEGGAIVAVLGALGAAVMML